MMQNRKYINDLVSVITPVYNAEKYIAKTLDSIMMQKYKNIEIILIDDCSKDNSAKIIRQYCNKYSNIVYKLQDRNMGAAVARNTALQIAKGRYVAFLDSDDIWLPEKTTKQLELMHNKNAAFTYTAIEMINEKDEVIKKKRKVRENIDYNFLLHNTMIPTSSVIIDRKEIGDFRMPLRRSGQDYATWLMILRDNVTAFGINETLVKYRISSNSLSSNKIKSIKQVWQIQTQDEGINKISAVWHVVCFCFNAFKKYFI